MLQICRNDRKVVTETVKEMDKMGRSDYEFVLVNDCSLDNGETIRILRQMANEKKYVKVVDLARNSGQH